MAIINLYINENNEIIYKAGILTKINNEIFYKKHFYIDKCNPYAIMYFDDTFINKDAATKIYINWIIRKNNKQIVDLNKQITELTKQNYDFLNVKRKISEILYTDSSQSGNLKLLTKNEIKWIREIFGFFDTLEKIVTQYKYYNIFKNYRSYPMKGFYKCPICDEEVYTTKYIFNKSEFDSTYIHKVLEHSFCIHKEIYEEICTLKDLFNKNVMNIFLNC